MSARRRVLTALGLALAGASVALAVEPGLARDLGLDDLVAAAGNAHLLVAGAGLVALLYGGFVWLSWSVAGVDQASPPAVEAFAGGAVPGAAFDTALAELAGERGRAARPVEHREWIRDRLRADAAATLSRTRDEPVEAATAAVEAGEWTDDRYASAFLGGPAAPGPRWYQRLWGWLTRRDQFSHRARRTVAAITALEGGS